MNFSDIKRLAAFDKDKNFGISLYMNIDAKERRHSDIQTVLNHLIDEEAKSLDVDHKQEKQLRVDLAKITDIFESERFFQGENRGIAIFSKASAGFFEFYYLAQPVDDRLIYSPTFFIRPLVGYLDLYGEFLAVLVDQSRGRFFEVEQGKGTDNYYFRDEVPNKVKEGGWYGYEEHHIERHVEDHLHQHFKKVAAKTRQLLEKYDYQWLILAGQPENLTNFKKTLHPYVSAKLKAEIPANIVKETSDQVMERIMNQMTEIRESQHHALEHELSDKYPYKAVLGYRNVDYELERKSVYKLLLSTRYRPVYPKTTPLIADLKINNELIKAIYQDSEIHFLQNEFLEKHSGIGAILRY